MSNTTIAAMTARLNEIEWDILDLLDCGGDNDNPTPAKVWATVEARKLEAATLVGEIAREKEEVARWEWMDALESAA